MLVKTADLGHASVDWIQHNEWSARVTEEFYQQVRETDNGTPHDEYSG